jgi:hypothetical protein
VLTGHASGILTDEQRAVCDTIAAHRTGDLFSTPRAIPRRVAEVGATPLVAIEHAAGRIEAWNDVVHEPASEIVTYWTFYRASDGRVWEAQSPIRFAGKKAIAARIAEAGLRVDRWMGDWRGGQWTPEAKEIIPVGSLAR